MTNIEWTQETWNPVVGIPQISLSDTGAASDSIHRVRQEFNAEELPLTVSFRCPQLVVREAQKYVSHIQAHPDAPLGTIDTINEEKLLMGTEFKDSDAVLCRNNAPLVDIAYKLIRMGTPCYVEGRDIGNGLLELASRWKVVNLSALKDRVIEYRRRNVAALLAGGKEGQADSLADKCDTLIALIQGMPYGSKVDALHIRIKTMFQDSDGSRKKCMTLSSIHKAKGREWERVFILGMNAYMPSRYAVRDWQKEQERNLAYVAITRSMNTLIYVEVK